MNFVSTINEYGATRQIFQKSITREQSGDNFRRDQQTSTEHRHSLYLHLFIAVCLTFGCFYWFRGGVVPWISDVPSANRNNTTAYNFFSQFDHHPLSVPAWQSRIISFKLAGWWTQIWRAKPLVLKEGHFLQRVTYINGKVIQDKPFSDPTEDVIDPGDNFRSDWPALWSIYASYNCVFIFALFVMLIFAIEKPLIPMLGTVAGLMCSTAPQFQPYIHPFDMPTMFLFTSAFLCYDQKHWWLLMAVVLAGGLIKESVLVAGLFFLGAPWGSYRRPWQNVVFVRLGVVAILVLTVHFIMGLIMPAGSQMNWMIGNVSGQHPWVKNIALLSAIRSTHPIFVNGGGLVVLIASLCKLKDWPLMVVIAAYLTGVFLFGWMLELRTFFEVLPMGWILAQRAFPKL